MNKVVNYVFQQFGKNKKILVEDEYPKLCAYMICLMGAVLQFLDMDVIKDENVSKEEFVKFANK